MKILFWTDSLIEFDGDIWRRAPCPGSELALIHSARALAEPVDVAVDVVCRTERPGRCDGVSYHRLDQAERALAEADVVVHVRDYWGRAPACGHAESRHILWFQDTSAEIVSLRPGATMDDLRARMLGFDGLVFVSEWHRAEVFAATGLEVAEEGERGVLTSDARVAPPTAVFHQPLPALADTPAQPTRRPATLIHTAHPRKAIANVLRAWPHIARQRRDVELVLCGHPQIYQQDTVPLATGGATLSDFVTRLVPGSDARVRVLPSALPQRELLAEVAAATVCLHPDTSVETGATTVLEAMAVGTVPVVSDAGCLPELCLGRGVVTPLGDDFAARYARDVLAVLDDADARAQLSGRGQRDWAHLSDPVHVAERWLALIMRCLEQAPAPASARRRSATGAAGDAAVGEEVRGRRVRMQGHRWRAVDADELPSARWGEFCARARAVWFTHSRSWYLAAERACDAIDAAWFGVVDDRGELAAVVPLAAQRSQPQLAVSGLREPAGLCLDERRSPAEQRALAELVVASLEARAAQLGASEIAIKSAALDRCGLRGDDAEWASAPLRALRLGRYGVRAAPLSVMTGGDRWARVSERTRTQILRGRERTRLIPVSSPAQFSTLCELYLAHTAEKGLVRFRPSELEQLWNAPEIDTQLFLMYIADRAVGFAIAIGLGVSMSLFAWGVDSEGRAAGVSKALVYDVCGLLLAQGAQAVECGGRFQRGAATGIDEFYRRLGAELHVGLYAARRLPPTARASQATEVSYAVR
ncbi:MAG: hypothetical protein Tsb0020_29380 [Haliangiales bacterium]